MNCNRKGWEKRKRKNRKKNRVKRRRKSKRMKRMRKKRRIKKGCGRRRRRRVTSVDQVHQIAKVIMFVHILEMHIVRHKTKYLYPDLDILGKKAKN